MSEKSDKKVELDPLVQKIADSFGAVVEGGELKEVPPANLAPSSNTVTLAEKVEMNATQTLPAPPEEKKNEPANPPPPPVTKKVTVKKTEPKAPPVVAAPPELPPAPQPPVALRVEKPAPPAPHAEEEYIKTLSSEQREELELAQYAETKFPEMKGKAAEMVGFFKKVDKFAEDHPELAPDSEEFSRFLETNRPKYKDGQRRQIEMQRVKEQAAEEAVKKTEATVQKEITELRRKQYEFEVRPVVERAAEQFRKILASDEIKVPEEVDPVAREVAGRINEIGYEEAVKEFPVEAPIVQSAFDAAAAYLNIANGLVEVDLSNSTHAWLAKFVSDQGTIFARQPAEKKMRVVDGQQKTFLPRAEFKELQDTNPAEAAKHWTFNDKMILDMIAVNSVLAVNGELKKLESGGFKRERKGKVSAEMQTASAGAQPAAPKTEEAASPKASASSLPGAATSAAAPHPNASFLDALVPGASQTVGIK